MTKRKGKIWIFGKKWRMPCMYTVGTMESIWVNNVDLAVTIRIW